MGKFFTKTTKKNEIVDFENYLEDEKNKLAVNFLEQSFCENEMNQLSIEIKKCLDRCKLHEKRIKETCCSQFLVVDEEGFQKILNADFYYQKETVHKDDLNIAMLALQERMKTYDLKIFFIVGCEQSRLSFYKKS